MVAEEGTGVASTIPGRPPPASAPPRPDPDPPCDESDIAREGRSNVPSEAPLPRCSGASLNRKQNLKAVRHILVSSAELQAL
jgi:hypothetical protein